MGKSFIEVVSTMEYKSSVYRTKSVKTYENQSNITKSVTTDCQDPDKTLAWTKDWIIMSYIKVVIWKFIRLMLRIAPCNINYSIFPSRWTKLYNILRGGDKSKWREQFYKAKFSSGNCPVDILLGHWDRLICLLVELS